MKKLVLALTAVAAFTGSALAADMAPAPVYTKAPPPVVAPSWTGFYIFGGAGGGVWDANTATVIPATGACFTCGVSQKMGGDGWYGTVGAGYDWQFNKNWVAGVFGDGQFGSLKGTIEAPGFFFIPSLDGQIKLRDSWAAGARIGYLVAPNVLSYVNGGYSGASWSGTTMNFTFSGLPSALGTNSFTQDGWFVGGGVENNLDIFGINMPGLFMKTEYRAAYYDTTNIPLVFRATGTPTPAAIAFNPLVQTISTSLVYRFNWGGPVVAKY
jgi:outer membrane immunogenic protein